MPMNMVIHLRLTKEMFIDLMELMNPCFLVKNNSAILGNLIIPWVLIRPAHTLLTWSGTTTFPIIFINCLASSSSLKSLINFTTSFVLSDILIILNFTITLIIDETHVVGFRNRPPRPGRRWCVRDLVASRSPIRKIGCGSGPGWAGFGSGCTCGARKIGRTGRGSNQAAARRASRGRVAFGIKGFIKYFGAVSY